MKSQLIFFDTPRNSGRNGTLRGIIALPLIIVTLFLYHRFCIPDAPMTVGRWVYYALFSLALCSAVGVQLPKTYLEAFLYCMLVGLVICTALGTSQPTQNLLTFLVIPLGLILSGVITRAMSLQLKLY